MLGHGYISTEERGSDCAGDAFSTHQGLLVRERYDNRPWSNLRVTAFCSEGYSQHFSRVVFLCQKGFAPLQIAFKCRHLCCERQQLSATLYLGKKQA